jgi:hypothetical protein
MTDIAIRDLTEDQYFELLKRKKRGDYQNWKEFFVDKLDLPE